MGGSAEYRQRKRIAMAMTKNGLAVLTDADGNPQTVKMPSKRKQRRLVSAASKLRKAGMQRQAESKRRNEVNNLIQELVYPNPNTNGNHIQADHLRGYVEAIARQDRELVKMMDKHAKFAFPNKDQSDKTWDTFQKLRKQMLHMSPEEIRKIRIPDTLNDVTGVTVENGEIHVHHSDGTYTQFDQNVSMWPF